MQFTTLLATTLSCLSTTLIPIHPRPSPQRTTRLPIPCILFGCAKTSLFSTSSSILSRPLSLPSLPLPQHLKLLGPLSSTIKQSHLEVVSCLSRESWTIYTKVRQPLRSICSSLKRAMMSFFS